ncbi:MAG: PQQ-binding-like beta-propeller repeat protein [Myxococcales bacterium]|nr:PQQ-binding-like beta-propeller repeat protein [Myxococcales bacterium]
MIALLATLAVDGAFAQTEPEQHRATEQETAERPPSEARSKPERRRKAAPPLVAPARGDWTFLDSSLEPQPSRFEGSFARSPAFHVRARLPGGALNAVTHAEWSDPVLYGDFVFTGSAAGNALYALSRQDGSVRRVYEASASVEAQPTIVGDRVYFSDTGGNTFCYDLAGELQWTHDGNAPVLVAPTVSDDGIWVVVTNVDDLAVALDAVSGELKWQYKAKRDLTRQAELSLFAAPGAVIHGDEVALGFSNGMVVAVELQTGEERWSRSVGEGRYPDIVADPVAEGTDLFTSGYFRPLVAIDMPSHNIRWRLDVGAAHPVSIGTRDGAVVLYHPGTDGSLRAVAALTGAELWRWSSDTTGALTTPLVTDAGLLVGSSEGGVYLVDPKSGEELWRWHEPWRLQGVSALPAIDGRQLVFLSNAGFLYSMLSPKVRENPDRRAGWNPTVRNRR